MSGTDFTASNGGSIRSGFVYDSKGGTMGIRVGSEMSVTLIEYGAHLALTERDAKLGRWRSVEHPDFVVYPQVGIECVWVLDERDGMMLSVDRADTAQFTAKEWRVVGAEFFAAHPVPEPKLWEQAQPGELWYLEDRHDTGAYLVIEDALGKEFIGQSCRFSTKFVGITAGRRIWPGTSHE